jgi:hypothetical protein
MDTRIDGFEKGDNWQDDKLKRLNDELKANGGAVEIDDLIKYFPEKGFKIYNNNKYGIPVFEIKVTLKSLEPLEASFEELFLANGGKKRRSISKSKKSKKNKQSKKNKK